MRFTWLLSYLSLLKVWVFYILEPSTYYSACFKTNFKKTLILAINFKLNWETITKISSSSHNNWINRKLLNNNLCGKRNFNVMIAENRNENSINIQFFSFSPKKNENENEMKLRAFKNKLEINQQFLELHEKHVALKCTTFFCWTKPSSQNRKSLHMFPFAVIIIHKTFGWTWKGHDQRLLISHDSPGSD